MGRKCLTCSHLERAEIEKAVIQNSASYRVISEMYSISFDSLQRHVKAGHITKELRDEYRTENFIRKEELEEQVRDLERLLYGFLRIAREKEEVKDVVLLIREIKGLIELLGRLLGRFPKETPQVAVEINILQNPTWIKIQQGIVAALLPFPEARTAVANTLAAIEGKNCGNG